MGRGAEAGAWNLWVTGLVSKLERLGGLCPSELKAALSRQSKAEGEISQAGQTLEAFISSV